MRSTRPSYFPLLKLPGEIRNRVYDFYLVPRNTDGSTKPVSPYQPELTRVNRVVRGETLSLFYASNQFELSIPIINSEIDAPDQLHQHIRLLRGIRSLVQNGYFQFMNDLAVHLISDPGAHDSGFHGMRRVLMARLLKKDTHILTSPIMRDYLPVQSYFLQVDRPGAGGIDWRNEDAVHHVVASYKERLSDELSAKGRLELSIEVENTPCCQMCQILSILLGNSSIIGHSERFLLL